MIIDTNVIVTVDVDHPNAAPHCVLRCLEVLRTARAETIALDVGGEIVGEYSRNVTGGVYPLSVGAQFVRELLNTQYDQSRCELVEITAHPARVFGEFPDDPRLASFDRSDRKFVAVSIASKNSHEIYNAVDTDWAAIDEVLAEFDVNVVYLCPSFTSPPPRVAPAG